MLGLSNIFNIFEDSDLFTLCGVRISHVAVWKWVQKFGSNVKDTLFTKNGSLPNVIVADETCIQVGSRQYYLYTAICSCLRY
jgi:transposase-like protein